MLASGYTNFTRALEKFGIKSASFYGAARKRVIPGTWSDKALVNLNVDPKWLFWGHEDGEPGSIEAELRRRNKAGRPQSVRLDGHYLTTEEAEAVTLAGEAKANVSQAYDPSKHFLCRVYGPRGFGQTAVATEAQPVGVVTSPHGGPESGRITEYGAVPRAAARLSAGKGLEPVMGSMGLYAFRKDWLDLACPDRQCVLLQVSGDSMDPDLRDGDLVLVDGAQTHVEPGRIYAVAVNGGIMVKRLDLLPGQLVLRSSNPQYQPVVLAANDEHVQVLGRAVWVGREL